MENFTFYSPTKFIFGRSTELKTGEAAAAYGAGKVLLVYGTSPEKTGLLGRVEESLRKANISWSVLKGIRPNPTDDRVYEGIEIVKREGIDFLLAIGGGSAIDTAKAIAIGAFYDGDFWDFYCRKAIAHKALPVGVVLTIPAAGSEGSGNSVITRREGSQKLSVRYPDILRPRFAIMNPELTMTLPWFQTACGVVDMMCHIFERYFSNTAGTELVDAYSEAIMRNVMASATILKENPDDYDRRADIMWASTLAHNGLCGVGKEEDWASHRLEHEISAFYDVAHGAGLAVMAPAWMTFAAQRNPDKLRRFAINVMSVDPEGKDACQIITEGIEKLKAFFRSMELTTSLRALIGGEPDIEMLTDSLHRNMGDILGCYVKLTMDDCREIYRLTL